MPLHEIRADFDATTIVVYQAYSPAIAEPAVEAQRFVAPFSMTRMPWVKPSFLWMMERSDWGRRVGQERILAVRITRAGGTRPLRSCRESTSTRSHRRSRADSTGSAAAPPGQSPTRRRSTLPDQTSAMRRLS